MLRFRSLLPVLALLTLGCANPEKGDGTSSPKKHDQRAGNDSILEKTSEKQEVVHYPNGNKKLTGQYRNGERHGVWTSWYKDGSIKSELRFRNGKRHGFYKTWYRNGKIRYEGQYHHGERTGTWKYYEKNGDLIRTEQFDHTEEK